MKKITNPQVKTLAEGKSLIAKQMSAGAGELLPQHHASLESVIVMMEGSCILHLEERDIILNPGDTFVIPAKVKHQLEAIEDFNAVHVMPGEIKFEFFR